MIIKDEDATATAVRVQAATRTARIASDDTDIIEWAARYFGSWWRAEWDPSTGERTPVDVRVSARLDPYVTGEISTAVERVPHETISYARTDLHVAFQGEQGLLASGADGVAYSVQDGRIGIAGTNPARVAGAACRLAREAVRGLLALDGWVLLHASAVVREGRAYLAFGSKGAGKTATALQLARATGGALLANDRVFARADADGTVVVLPWPAAGAVGLGLLDAGGWYDNVAVARDGLHDSTTDEVRNALALGHRQAIHGAEREHKAQLYPDQFTTLLGLPLATNGAAFALLFPTIDSAAEPSINQGGREITTDDTFAGKEEDRYPNVFGLRQPEPDDARNAVFRALNLLPRLSVRLGHNVRANTQVLAEFD